MTTERIAAIREAAERIIHTDEDPTTSPKMKRQLSVVRARNILALLDEAKADSKCQLEPPDNDIDFPHCSRCACMIQIIEYESFGETVKTHDDYCPGCGREIERGEQG